MQAKPPATAAPRVAVIVPAYGVAHLVGEALDSLLAQSFASWECVVIDDGAPDDVAGAVAPYLDDPRIRFLATDNRGVPGARNRAIAATTAPYIALLDGDDMFCPDYLEQMVAALDADAEARIATCNGRMFGAIDKPQLCVDRQQGAGDGTVGTLGEVLDRSFNMYIGSMFRRSDFDRIGGFDESFSHCEDFDLWVRLLLPGGHVRYVDAVLGEYRVRSGSLSGDAANMINGELRVYEKTLVALGGRPEAAIARRMIEDCRDRLAFERSLSRVADGDTAGLRELRETLLAEAGPAWKAALLLWKVAPKLAPPMLRWRYRANSRGHAGRMVPPLANGPAKQEVCA